MFFSSLQIPELPHDVDILPNFFQQAQLRRNTHVKRYKNVSSNSSLHLPDVRQKFHSSMGFDSSNPRGTRKGDKRRSVMAMRSKDVDPAKQNPNNLSPDTTFILPHIQRYNEDAEIKKKRRITFSDDDEFPSPQREIATVRLPLRDDDRVENGFPRRSTTTANGKAHLIGPKNKLEILSDYGKAMKGGLITYEQYMKNLSSLSLHKITLANSVERHFHIVR